MMLLTALPFLGLYIGLTLTLGWIDWRTGILPDRYTCPLLWCGLLFSVAIRPDDTATFVLSAVVGYGSFALIYWLYRGLRGREGLGYGDVKYFAALAAWHGWPLLPALAVTACTLALIFICAQALAFRTWQALKSPLHFGPFLTAAGYIIGTEQWLSFRL